MQYSRRSYLCVGMCISEKERERGRCSFPPKGTKRKKERKCKRHEEADRASNKKKKKGKKEKQLKRDAVATTALVGSLHVFYATSFV